MYPTIKKGDRIICLKRTQSLKFKRGDIIVFQDQNDSSQLLVKRLIGLPGEELTVSKNRVFINSIPVPEYYLSETSIDYTLAAVTIPKGHVFVLGDNRNNSSDSATWGALNFKQVKGKVFLRYWPAARIGATRFSPHKTS